MNEINLQNKTTAEKGYAEKYWFENEKIGLKKTLFHRIHVPLTPFNSGLEYEDQPVETEIVIEWLNLNLKNPDNLDNLKITSMEYKEMECSTYVGSAHNPCEVRNLVINHHKGNVYDIKGELFVYFELEGVGKNESFNFQTTIEYKEND